LRFGDERPRLSRRESRRDRGERVVGEEVHGHPVAAEMPGDALQCGSAVVPLRGAKTEGAIRPAGGEVERRRIGALRPPAVVAFDDRAPEEDFAENRLDDIARNGDEALPPYE
jgi:hypothetical protein